MHKKIINNYYKLKIFKIAIKSYFTVTHRMIRSNSIKITADFLLVMFCNVKSYFLHA